MEGYIAVVGIVEYERHVLLGKKKDKPGHAFSGRWHLPGGKAEPGETDEQALCREMEEEAGIHVRVERLLGQRVDPRGNSISRYFLCSPLAHDVTPGSDLVEVKYVPKDDVLGVCDVRDSSLWPPEVREYLSSG